MEKAVLYARVSSKEQEKEGYSIPAQIELLKGYAQKNNIKIDKIFTESETAKRAGRKAFNEMLAYMKKNKINIILVEKTDRLYRNFKDYVTLEEIPNLVIHFVKDREILDEKAPASVKLAHGFRVLIAKNYIDNLRDEVNKGRAEKIKQGGYPHKAPLGYLNATDKNTNKKTIILDKEKAPFIKRVFEMYSTGVYSVDEIRQILYKEGFNNGGKPYSKPKMLQALKDPFYIGKCEIKGVIYDGKHTPIIDVDLYNKVQKMFNQSKARSHDVEFAYTGLITCGHCGCQMTAELKKGKYVYYHCTGKRGGTCKKDYIREELIDEVFLDLIGRIPNPEGAIFDIIRNSIMDIRKSKGEFEETSTEAIQKQIERLNARIDNLYTDKLDGRISEEFWREKHNLWYSEKDALINKLKELNNVARTFDEGTNLLANFCKHAPQAFLKANAKKKQQILKMIGSNFVYKNKKLSVELNSVFDLLINNHSVNYGGTCLPKLELYNFVSKLEKAMSQEFICQLKGLDLAA